MSAGDGVGKIFKLSREARPGLEWTIAYHEGKTGTEIVRRYGITRKLSTMVRFL